MNIGLRISLYRLQGDGPPSMIGRDTRHPARPVLRTDGAQDDAGSRKGDEVTAWPWRPDAGRDVREAGVSTSAGGQGYAAWQGRRRER